MENFKPCKIMKINFLISMQPQYSMITKAILLIFLEVMLLSCSSNCFYKSTTTHTSSLNETTLKHSKYENKKSSNRKDSKVVISRINGKENVKKNLIIKRNLNICKVRPEPSFNKSPFARLKGGDVVEKIKEKGNWIKVGYEDLNKDKIIGWINVTDLEKARKFPKNKVKLAEVKIRKNDEISEEQLSPM